jgi:DHA1 family inner membrane transport protein
VATIEWYLLGRFLLGVANGVVFLLVIKYAGLRVSGDLVARVQGVLGALFTFGLAVGVASSPALVARVGPQGFSIIAAVPVAIAAVVTPTLHSAETGAVPAFRAYVSPFNDPSAIALGLGNAASYGLLIVALTWYTDIVSRTPALPVTLVLTSFAVATFVGRTGSGWLTTFTSEARAVSVSLLFLSGALALVSGALATGSAVGLAAGLALTGFGFGFPFGPLFSLAFADIGADAGVLLVGMTALGNAAALVYPWLVGRLLAATDAYVAAFVVMAGSVFAVLLCWQFAVDSRTTVASREP